MNGSKAPPYGVWRRFLVLTGRVPQEIDRMGLMGSAQSAT